MHGSENGNLFVMIFLIFQNSARTVNLFCKDQSHQLMRKGELGERPIELCSLNDGVIEAECAANQEHQVLTAIGSTLLQKSR